MKHCGYCCCVSFANSTDAVLSLLDKPLSLLGKVNGFIKHNGEQEEGEGGGGKEGEGRGGGGGGKEGEAGEVCGEEGRGGNGESREAKMDQRYVAIIDTYLRSRDNCVYIF